jgi:transcriptional regulator GlxA family with amidase domain
MRRPPDTRALAATTVLVVVTPGVLLLDLAGVAEPFRVANAWSTARGDVEPFALRVVGARREVVTSLPIKLGGVERLPARLPPASWVVLAGTSSAAAPDSAYGNDRATVHWLREVVAPAMATHGARVWTVCSGAFFAARAGLLDGRQCTTHHSLIERLAAEHPALRVQANRIFVVDGAIATSAGITAGIDLALHAIGDRLGQAAALAVARELVVFHRRAGADPQLSAALRHRNHLHPALHRAQDALLGDPASRWSVRRLADAAHVTPRHLARLFHDNACIGPLEYLQQVRLELARGLLAGGGLSLEQAAQRAGFSSAHHLRRVQRRSAPPD